MEFLAVFAPLFGFLLAFAFGRQLGDKGAQFVTCAAVFLATLASAYLFYDVILRSDPRVLVLATWIESGDFTARWALRVDQLSVVMMAVVNLISLCVHVYSIGYMNQDPAKARFFAYLSLFTFAMLMLVSADDLLQLFFGWEAVGLASYLLIGFWNHKPSAGFAANKAFIVNRIGDLGLVLAVIFAFVLFGSVQFETIFALAPDMAERLLFRVAGVDISALTVLCLLFFMGAAGKSAQLGLHTWLPDAMEGPTPVSALIHAATMVTAGVFLIVRLSPLFEYAPAALAVVCVFGALTAFVAATIGLTQFDIKRVIAYSTMSQLGYMFFALGVSAYGAAMFHLVTHAFFKALLFLGAGSVIHAMSGEQDMRKMGGIWSFVPVTYVFMWIGSLALAGMPFFAGFYSKDLILEAAWASRSGVGVFAFWLGVAAAVMTAFYSWRLILMTFHGKPRADDHVMAHVHESPSVMMMPLAFLAAGAIMAGSALYGGFVGEAREVVEIDSRGGQVVTTYLWSRDYFWGDSLFVLPENDSVAAAHHVPLWVKIVPVLAAFLGIVLAVGVYARGQGIPQKIAQAFGGLYRLSYNKWYVDEIYARIIVAPLLALGRLFATTGDRGLIDRFGPDGAAEASRGVGGVLRRIQSGYVFHYALAMIIGMVGFLAAVGWFLWQALAGGV